jgi:hypothetical protein
VRSRRSVTFSFFAKSFSGIFHDWRWVLTSVSRSNRPFSTKRRTIADTNNLVVEAAWKMDVVLTGTGLPATSVPYPFAHSI